MPCLGEESEAKCFFSPVLAGVDEAVFFQGECQLLSNDPLHFLLTIDESEMEW